MGTWSGESRHYTIVRRMGSRARTDLDLKHDGAERSWSYGFGDGWVARVTARVVPSKEKLKKSDGFSGYDWMVQSILSHGDIRT